MCKLLPLLLAPVVLAAGGAGARAAGPAVVKSAKSGSWSDPATWDSGRVPAAGEVVLVRGPHVVTYDIDSDRVIRAVHVAGTLTFAHDRNTRLDVGLVRVTPAENTTEDGFGCDHSGGKPAGPADPAFALPGFTAPCRCCDDKAALLVGTPEQPIGARHTAVIRLHYVDGMDKESCPAVVCCGGRMDFHGRPMSRTWVKLGATAEAGATEVVLAEEVTGWNAGDRVIVTATEKVYANENEEAAAQKRGSFTLRPGNGFTPGTEERVVKAVAGTRVTLDRPLKFRHAGDGHYRGEVANLTRNVVVESADPAGVRGHTMYHKGSAGSVSYAEFRHLGKEGVLGKYALHFHLCRDTMRGSSVVGASVWDSHNRWVTVHGTEYLVVRDCVGYKSVGHGFFLEDGTEVYNVFDRNLAIQAYDGKPLPKQVLPFDPNDGAAFWWANSLNTFTRNVAVEYDTHGFRFHAQPRDAPPVKGKPAGGAFDLRLPVRQPDGTRRAVDVRTLPFVRFEGNEAHSCLRPAQPQWGLNMGMGNDGVGPDRDHPFVVRDLKVWNVFGAMAVQTPCVLFDGLRVGKAGYVFRDTQFVSLDYRDLALDGVMRRRFPGEAVTRRFDGIPPYSGPQERAELKPADDLPPATVVTHVARLPGDRLRVRGTTSDNGTVAKVVVNGREAAATAANFAEWEVVLDGVKAGERKVAARAADDKGNAEATGHELTVVVR
ncbi:MAG: hypothetical protein C0501_10085 [Isosphaera sp.]|nr:hypothetical protein [Isosphaera sp.]